MPRPNAGIIPHSRRIPIFTHKNQQVTPPSASQKARQFVESLLVKETQIASLHTTHTELPRRFKPVAFLLAEKAKQP